MSILLNGDCLELMKDLDDDSVDLIFCDLPYAATNCSWDVLIDLDLFWIQVMRIKKLNTPIFFTATTKFGVSLIQSAPKKCFFRYDLVWVKSASTGFLSAKKMPMRKHEMIYVFYEKLPFYDLSSHTHKFIKETEEKFVVHKLYGNGGKDKQNKSEGIKKVLYKESSYDPPLPVSVVKEETGGATGIRKDKHETAYGENIHHHLKKVLYKESSYDPPLPNSILEIKSTRGKHSTEKPVELMEWILKYYSKEGDTILDPTMGSGSTGVACKNMNRNFIGMEMDPEIYEVAVNRIEN